MNSKTDQFKYFYNNIPKSIPTQKRIVLAHIWVNMTNYKVRYPLLLEKEIHKIAHSIPPLEH